MLALKKKNEMSYIEAMIFFTKHIKYKVAYFRSELRDIYNDFDNEFLRECGYLEKLRSDGMVSATEEYSKRFYVRDYEYEAIKNFALLIGKSAWENQVEMCEALITVLENYLNELSVKYPDEKKLYSSLGIITGLLCALVLL